MTANNILVLLPDLQQAGYVPGSAEKHIRAAVPNVDNVTVRLVSREQHIDDEDWKDVTCLLTLAILPPSSAVAPKMKYIQTFSAGIDHLMDMPYIHELQEKKLDVMIANASGVHGPQIAEWVIMSILSLSHKLPAILRWQDKHFWGQQRLIETTQRLGDQWGRRIGIFGYGAVGRQVARVCSAMGMDVVAYSHRNPPRKTYKEIAVPGSGDSDGTIPSKWFAGRDTFRDFLSCGLDVILISAPLTPDTRGIFNAEAFELMKGALLVNIARGGLVNTSDLITALCTGTLNGAALDVTDPEPLPADHPLWEAPNVIISPHISGHSAAYVERVLRILCYNLNQFNEPHPDFCNRIVL
ncbi:hypothetical protein CANCADRAFT_3467 [Tortispora caseinolytica NRRL Y-17796]|uniref:D-isomer specific 2-hydroxyacid dehydrogenase NAD-binding domain-containing protein n=1 Tax=Tortispora caseinolytica NRRL Y-17796 TaxID=767744 RepID=A0A1E4TAP6_9ASCO|nr:hypothetical protein CANCADRAFT_3467 [Tortispora caseinolytica NRRL Y-17796]